MQAVLEMLQIKFAQITATRLTKTELLVLKHSNHDSEGYTYFEGYTSAIYTVYLRVDHSRTSFYVA